MFRGLAFVPHSRRLLILVAPLPFALLLVAGALAWRTQQEPPPQPVDLHSLAEIPPVPGILIYVSGAVTHPGMYRLQRGDRLYDAVAAAGGFTPDADPLRLPDLAQRLRDGEQVKVPIIGISSTGSSVRITKLDLNSASASELASIPGFTSDMVSAVLAYRDGYGGFANTNELVTILGMGQAEYTAAKPYLKV